MWYKKHPSCSCNQMCFPLLKTLKATTNSDILLLTLVSREKYTEFIFQPCSHVHAVQDRLKFIAKQTETEVKTQDRYFIYLLQKELYAHTFHR